jgi:hypothetical protein
MQAVSPTGQTHAAFVHVPPDGHAFPQPPQLAAFVWVSTQTIIPIGPKPAQEVSPVAQPIWHWPLTHWLPGPQRLPHDPQLFGAELVSTHSLLHVARPPPHAHAPATQFAPAPHTRLHMPQLEGSVASVVHSPLQLVWPAAHTVVHAPLEHTLFAPVHALPQLPQFFGSLWVLVQTLSQSLPSLKHWQLPAWQVVPVGHFVAQPPQLPLSDCSLTHAPLHMTSPPGQMHLPPVHVSPTAHAVPQPPQSAGLLDVSTQTPPQYVGVPVPAGHVHALFTHVEPPVQALPHPPQLALSLVSLTHEPPHVVSPAPQLD